MAHYVHVVVIIVLLGKLCSALETMSTSEQLTDTQPSLGYAYRALASLLQYTVQ